jgi:hypothetical protein
MDRQPKAAKRQDKKTHLYRQDSPSWTLFPKRCSGPTGTTAFTNAVSITSALSAASGTGTVVYAGVLESAEAGEV